MPPPPASGPETQKGPCKIGLIHKLLQKWHPFYIPRAKLHPFLIPQGQGKTVEYPMVEVFPLGFQLPWVSYLGLQAFLCFLLLFLPKFGSLFYTLFKLLSL